MKSFYIAEPTDRLLAEYTEAVCDLMVSAERTLALLQQICISCSERNVWLVTTRSEKECM